MINFTRKLLLVQFVLALSLTTVAAEEEEAIFWKDRQISQLEQLTPSLVESVQSMQKKNRFSCNFKYFIWRCFTEQFSQSRNCTFATDTHQFD